MLKVLIGVVLGAVLALGTCVLLVVTFTGPEPSVQVEAPETVFVDRPFTVRLLISNPHAEAIAIANVDIDSESLDGFHVEAISPEPTPDSPNVDFGSHTWYFERTLQPSASESIEFTFRPQGAPGTRQIPLEVCNFYQDCSRTLLSIEVAPLAP